MPTPRTLRTRLLATFAVILTGAATCALVLVRAPVAQEADARHREVEVGGVRYRIFEAEPERLRLHRGDFEAVAREVAARGEAPVFMMNSGIFEPGLVPTGLHVEEGEEVTPLNLRSGRGNFFLTPNGVFAVSRSGRATIEESVAYGKRAPADVRLATQSGPLLRRGGKNHPRLSPGSTSRKRRNGVGIGPAGEVIFAMSDPSGPLQPTLHDFAQLFGHLGCDDALYLDGTISRMYVRGRDGLGSRRFAGVLAVVEGQAP